jgi:hypothetical protein
VKTRAVSHLYLEKIIQQLLLSSDVGADWIDGLQVAVDQVKRCEVPCYLFHKGEEKGDEEERDGRGCLGALVSYMVS